MEQLAVVGLKFVLLFLHLQHLLRDDCDRVSDGVSLGWSILKFQPIELFFQFLLRLLLSMVKIQKQAMMTNITDMAMMIDLRCFCIILVF